MMSKNLQIFSLQKQKETGKNCQNQHFQKSEN